MSRNLNQTVINQMSLVMNLQEDITKAAIKAELHPDMTTVLVRMHVSQKEIEKEINCIRNNMLEQAKIIDMMADHHRSIQHVVSDIISRTGIGKDELFRPNDEDS